MFILARQTLVLLVASWPLASEMTILALSQRVVASSVGVATMLVNLGIALAIV